MSKKSTLLLLYFLLLTTFVEIDCLASKLAQNTEDDDKQCVYVSNLKEDVCASMKTFGECSVLLTVTMGGLTIYSNTMTLQQLSTAKSQELCGQAGTCQMCFIWDVSTNEWGKATGCISLEGSCVSSPTPLPLGCFEDSDLRSCPLPCKNDCSGNGECQYSGICDCKIGRYGDDCSAECKTEGQEGGQRIFSGNSTIFSASSLSPFKAYLFVSPLIAQINLTLYDVSPVIDDTSSFNYSIYSLKSCYPNPTAQFYDQSVLFNSTNGDRSVNVPVMSNCHDIDGGVWFFLIECDNKDKANCSFLLHVNEEEVIQMEDLVSMPGELMSSAPINYYQFNVETGPFTFELTTPMNSPNLTIELLPFQCPSNSFTFLKLTAPNYKDQHIAKYFLSASTPQIGDWYAKISLIDDSGGNSVRSSSQLRSVDDHLLVVGNSQKYIKQQQQQQQQPKELIITYDVYYAKVQCNESCIYGSCYGSPLEIDNNTNDTTSTENGVCYCQEQYSGPTCSDYTPLITQTSSLTIQDATSTHSTNNHQSLIMLLLSVIVLVSVCGLLVCCCVGCIICIRRCYHKRKSSHNPRADSLYNMLTQEQDLTLDFM